MRERLNGALLDFGFQTASAESALDTAICIKERLGADLLRAGALDAGDYTQGYGFAFLGSFGQRLKYDILHVQNQDTCSSGSVQQRNY